MLFQIGEVITLRPMVWVIIEEAKIAAVRFLPVCELCLHVLQYPIFGGGWRVIFSDGFSDGQRRRPGALSSAA